ncbi:unnamed protein product [Urochloa humidicola]
MASSEAAICNPLLAPPMSSNNLQQQALMMPHQQQRADHEEPAAAPPPAKKKKKRSLPGTPDPDAEVIALSPGTLLATNRFVCEICGKGFQRDQNLQLHRRGHNLPWKLRQRAAGKEARKRVYVCPEKSCVHHNPARALGDLTGIKKHFCRKHGEKKWKCDKCSKRYAVQSDWKAHAKTCGTREYRCDCGTIFCRRDSFITHRAFCDALAEETARLSAASASNTMSMLPPAPPPPAGHQLLLPPMPLPSISSLQGSSSSWLYGAANKPNASELISTTEYTTVPSVASSHANKAPPSGTTHDIMSATALLQRAAQMGAVTSTADACMFAGHHLYGDVLSAAAVLKQQDAAVVGSRDETRDFLGVGAVHTLCSSASLPPLHGWI